MQHKLTDRQLIALLAVYHHQRIWDEPSGVYGAAHKRAGQPYWRSRTRMGGAVQRMCDSIRDAGLVTEAPDRWEQDKPFADNGGQLTVTGYEALLERHGKFPVVKSYRDDVPCYDMNTHVTVADLRERMEARREREAELARLRKEWDDQQRVERERLLEAAKADQLRSLRDLFSKEGLADNWDDDKLLAFADRVASI